MKTILMSCAVLFSIIGFAFAIGTSDDKQAIKQIMLDQQNAWNAGDIDRFMAGYWKSDQLTFSSGGKTVRGWQSTLDRYRKRYPDKATMGQLTFSDLEVTLLSPDAAMTLGRWHLKRDEPIGGNFSLVWRRIDGKWRIIHDHSSSLEKGSD